MRMPHIQLRPPKQNQMTLSATLKKRRSFEPEEAASLERLAIEDVSNIFGTALTLLPDNSERRPYPSGGALYPIEIYYVGTFEGGLKPRVYHYNSDTHSLADLWPTPDDFTLKEIFPSVEVIAPTCMLMTAVWGRSATKYGDFSYYLGMLEAGHIAQNILLSATAYDIAARPFGGFDDGTVSKLLDLDSTLEQPVYAIMFGKNRGSAQD